MLRPLQDILLDRGDQVCWFIERDNVNHSYFKEEERLINTVLGIFEYQPDAVLAPGNTIPSFLPGLKVAIFHGFDAGKLDRKGNNDHFKIRGCFDLYCTQGPSTTAKFQELQKIYQYFNVIETGWPALDKLFINNSTKVKNTRPVIFFGSTFSKRLTQARNNFEQVKHLSETMDWQWIVSLHPKSDLDVIDMYRSILSDNLRYVETDDMLPILQEADIMVGDTSSALTMFIVQNKPVVTAHNIDPKPYMLNITSPEQLKGAIEQALSQPPELMQEIENYINQTHPYTDGKSAERVVSAIDRVLAGELPLKVKKPLNFLRDLKFRKYLSYWKFL
jgi:CDP-glycerol glycerophosphotransferase (TagB/SpsB family)